tara:strand:+ start:95 stop:697 length:603 start_codon:yes stop_codon:yes gene_type:complete
MSINKFTVQESVNGNAFSDWHYEELDLNDGSSSTDSTCDTDHTAGSGSSFGGNPKIIQMDDTSALSVGMSVSGTGVAAGSYITQIDSSTLFRVSADTTATNNNQTLTFVGGADTETSTYITNSKPAKKIVLYEVPGSASSYLQDIDTLTLTINGQTDSVKKIKIDATDLPFTISGTMMTSLSVAVDQANLTDKIALLSFH